VTEIPCSGFRVQGSGFRPADVAVTRRGEFILPVFDIGSRQGPLADHHLQSVDLRFETQRSARRPLPACLFQTTRVCRTPARSGIAGTNEIHLVHVVVIIEVGAWQSDEPS